MNNQYCLIYGSTDENPGLFIIGVSKNQNMINGFREEHYHFCVHGEVVRGYDYDKLAPDFEISSRTAARDSPVLITSSTIRTLLPFIAFTSVSPR